jgi:hypothetical protein
LILPLIYFLGWWQTGSFRQAFNATVAWIFGYAIAAGSILALDVGGYDGVVRATPDSPGAALAILGGFVGMWISNILWRRRGGDPPRQPGKWERTFRAMFGQEQRRPKKRRPASQAPPPPPQQAPPHQQPVDAQYRPAPQYQNAPAQSQAYPAPPNSQGHAHQPQYQSAPMQPQQAGPHGYPAPPSGQQPPRRQPASRPSQQGRRNSPTMDKYAKATGRALGAMFGGKKSKSTKRSGPR